MNSAKKEAKGFTLPGVVSLSAKPSSPHGQTCRAVIQIEDSHTPEVVGSLRVNTRFAKGT
jgi:hypothetical protein